MCVCVCVICVCVYNLQESVLFSILGSRQLMPSPEVCVAGLDDFPELFMELMIHVLGRTGQDRTGQDRTAPCTCWQQLWLPAQDQASHTAAWPPKFLLLAEC